jgi:CheY-like chemotaxis protein/HPt (histidine-containing phosphotransfer) domain-containing protein
MRIIGGQTAMMSRSSLDYRQAKVAKNATILVAEDHAVNQQVAQLYLAELGYQSHIVNNGREALDALRGDTYALILMDCQMPELDGLTATRLIRQGEQETGGHIGIIAMTAHAMEGDREVCLAAGMDDYLSKPIDPEQLARVLDKWIDDVNFSQVVVESPSKSAEPVAREITDPIDNVALRSRYREYADEILGTFIKNLPAELERLELAVKQNDLQLVLNCAHGLKGMAGTVCAQPMQETCRHLEQIALIGDIEAVKAIVQDLFAQYEHLKHRLG